MSDDEAVHLNPDSLEEYFRLKAVSVFQLSKKVEARLEIDPITEQLRLYVPAEDSPPDVTGFERIKVDRVSGPPGASRYRLVFDASRMHYTAYQLIESVVAHLRDGMTFRRAVVESIADMKDLLTSRGRLTEQEETGLWGELLLLEHIVEKLGEVDAIRSWLGPKMSEHDFSFDDFEVEVKTTRSEVRRHHIGSETQLEASPGRPLLLLSVQATLAGAADSGRTLPQIIGAVRERLDRTTAEFDAGLHQLGYRRDDADLYPAAYQLRSLPRAYVVDDVFPAITRTRLTSAIPDLQLLSDVRYRIDVGSLPFCNPPAPLHDFCEVPH